MVDELTQESFQTGKAIVTVSVDLITAIAEACKRSEEKNPGMSAEQKETLLGKVVDKVVSNYKETHGSLKDFNKEGKDVTSIDVNDERTAEILKKACKKSHIPVDMREVTWADGSVTHTAFCEVKNIDQVAALLNSYLIPSIKLVIMIWLVETNSNQLRVITKKEDICLFR